MEKAKTVAIARMTMEKKVAIAEAQLNSMYAAAFSTDSGRKVLEHLNHELRSVEPLDSSTTRVLHREGARFAIKSIINRVEEGKKNV